MSEEADVASRVKHLVDKDTTLLTSKMSTTVLNGGVRTTHGINSAGFLASFGQATGQMMLFGVVAATSAVVTQMEYRHKIGNIIDMYKEELSAKLHKPAHKLVEKDLDILAKGDAKRGIASNESLAKELSKLRTRRTIGIGISMVASLITLVAVSAAVNALPLVMASTAVTAIKGAMFGIPMLLGEGVLGVAIYNTIKAPLKKITHKLLGLDYTTTHERIAHLSLAHGKGKTISQAQVLDVFASANPVVDREIVDRFGGHFHQLDAQQKREAVREVGKLFPLAKLTDDINHGAFKIPELVFAAHGQMSGVRHDVQSADKPQGMMTALAGRLGRVVGLGKSHTDVSTGQASSGQPIPTYKTAAHEWANHPADQRRAGASFAEQVKKTGPAMGAAQVT